MIQSNAPLSNVESNLSAGDMPSGIDAAKIHNGSVSNTEFGHLNGVTSAIQTQISSKVSDSGDTMTGLLTMSGSDIMFAGGTLTNFIYSDTDAKRLSIYGGNSNSAYIALSGNTGANEGGIRYWLGTSSNAYHGLADKNFVERLIINHNGVKTDSEAISIPTGGAWTTLCAIDGAQTLRFATVTAHGTILLEWDGTTLTKLTGAATLVVSGSPSGTEIGFRVSGGNLQASNGTGTSRNGSSGFSIQH